jgi:alkanesulfonate monooxygenase SsuD/methylene tetrahydromethanopterin reductase-like flavin-dependent oxidoreductase (luciferase family)
MSALKFGVYLPVRGPSDIPGPKPWILALQYKYNNLNLETVKQTTLTAEKHGYNSAWVVDHYSTPMARQRLECWTTMTWLAAITSKIRIGSLVLCPLYRDPTLLAKMASTLDHISNGRLELGLGACPSFNKAECDAMGIPWVGPATRIKILKENIDVCKQLWSKDKANYEGDYFTLRDAVCEPKPLQKPFPPITIAGWGNRMLRLIAEYADRVNFGGPQMLSDRIEVLRGHCDSVGRDYDSLEKTLSIGVVLKRTREEYLGDMKQRFVADGSHGDFEDWLSRSEEYFIAGTVDDCVEQIKPFIDLGVTSFMIRFGDMPDLEDMSMFAKEVIPRL